MHTVRYLCISRIPCSEYRPYRVNDQYSDESVFGRLCKTNGKRFRALLFIDVSSAGTQLAWEKLAHTLLVRGSCSPKRSVSEYCSIQTIVPISGLRLWYRYKAPNSSQNSDFRPPILPFTDLQVVASETLNCRNAR